MNGLGAATQTLPVQFVLTQSELTRHCLPLPQAAHTVPPQSTSVSLPSLVPSVQLVGGGVPVGSGGVGPSSQTRELHGRISMFLV